VTAATPHNERAERVLLAGLIREPQLVTEACRHHGVRDGDLYVYAHRLVWDAAWSLIDSGLVPDLVGVYQTLRCRGQLKELPDWNAAVWLWELYETDPTGAWCDWACAEVVAYAQERAEIHSAAAFLQNKLMGRKTADVYAMR
jgi:replicative DNA helicase